jgi:hypothetical protein
MEINSVRLKYNQYKMHNIERMEFTHQWFIDSSKEWMKNKRKKRTAYYYTCEYTYKYGKVCGRDCFKQEAFCQQHWAILKNQEAQQQHNIQ